LQTPVVSRGWFLRKVVASDSSVERVPLCQVNETFSPTMDVEAIDAGFKVIDSNGQSIAYVYGHADKRDAETAAAAWRGRSPKHE
jgi:hypothetical protein